MGPVSKRVKIEIILVRQRASCTPHKLLENKDQLIY